MSTLLNSTRCLKASIQIYQSEPPRTVVVPNRSDVLKQSNLQSFKTRRCNFAMDGKITPTRRRSERKTGKASPLRRVGLIFVTVSF
ncbi:hypothetical protein HMPREF9554_02086 [Treponema phagedenis F0421]|nr:hypothetical protein HMPREF9554_02086 [Treponema phagedenis F0421]